MFVFPFALDFRNGGGATIKTVTLLNPSFNHATATISSIVTQGSADFSVNQSRTSCGSTLAPGASCTIAVAFDPSARGSLWGQLVITDNARNSPQTVYLAVSR